MTGPFDKNVVRGSPTRQATLAVRTSRAGAVTRRSKTIKADELAEDLFHDIMVIVPLVPAAMALYQTAFEGLQGGSDLGTRGDQRPGRRALRSDRVRNGEHEVAYFCQAGLQLKPFSTARRTV